MVLALASRLIFIDKFRCQAYGRSIGKDARRAGNQKTGLYAETQYLTGKKNS